MRASRRVHRTNTHIIISYTNIQNAPPAPKRRDAAKAAIPIVGRCAAPRRPPDDDGTVGEEATTDPGMFASSSSAGRTTTIGAGVTMVE